MSDGLQLAREDQFPEHYSNPKDNQAPEYHDASQSERSEDFKHNEKMLYTGEAKCLTILGLRRRNFWVLVALALILTAAIVGGSVGGALAVRKSGDKSEINTQSTPSPSPSPLPAIKPSLSFAPEQLQSSTATPTLSAPTGTVYTALPFTEVTAINITCPSALYLAGQDIVQFKNKYQFNCMNKKNMASVSDLMSFTAYSFQQCVDACMQWNAMGNRPMCMASVIASTFQYRRTSGNGANCWLKVNSSTIVDSEDTTIAAYVLPSS